MSRITDERVSAANDIIAQATSTGAAFDLIEGLSRTMLAAVMDLNHLDVDTLGLGRQAVAAVGYAHGWEIAERDDYRPADGRGPCRKGFEPGTVQHYVCSHCDRRPIDHRRVLVAA